MGEKRLVMPKKSVKLTMQDTVLVPSVDAAIANATTLIANELAFYCSKTARGITLSLAEARTVREYVSALVALSKEARERVRADDLSNLSSEELVQLGIELLKNNKNTQSIEINNNESNKGQQDEDEGNL